ncbi:hypothetical protein BAOM_1393 [Peribacillus asahii]|uniref:Uncharacterized protein n=1 Tax=Peribacillus asahii TaxID=228899 RepID=A0A3Q9RL11_9BACI|nr:hypothetical protein [Peribacillus asahii]AZV42003.1 hypothetical protein BAOM_1393 [Peribacillus asahii]
MSYWVNIDIRKKKCTIHNCEEKYIRNTEFKGRNELKRDGGWFSFDEYREAVAYCKKTFPKYKIINNIKLEFVTEMNNIIKKMKDKIREKFIVLFESDNFPKGSLKSNVKTIKVTKLKSHNDIESLLYGNGFYIIVTNCEFDNNPCKLSYKNKYKAIYRGHGSRVKKRIESHMFNKRYNLDRDGTTYDVCMQIETGFSGINIDEPRYSQYEWYIITISMPNSSLLIREQAEVAFDEVFGRPLASREKEKN